MSREEIRFSRDIEESLLSSMILYGIISVSGVHGNRRDRDFEHAWKSSDRAGEIYLFFSVNFHSLSDLVEPELSTSNCSSPNTQELACGSQGVVQAAHGNHRAMESSPIVSHIVRSMTRKSIDSFRALVNKHDKSAQGSLRAHPVPHGLGFPPAWHSPPGFVHTPQIATFP